MARDADAEIRDLAELGIELDADTERAFRDEVARQNALAPAPDPPSKSTVKRVAAQKKPPRRR